MRELGLGLGGLQHIIYDGKTTRAIGSMMDGEKKLGRCGLKWALIRFNA
jgi:hypothetical protein